MLDAQLQEEREKSERLRIRCGVLKTLGNHNNWWYLSQIKPVYHRMPKLFQSVLEELIGEGCVAKIEGRAGSTILARCIRGIPLNPNTPIYVKDAVTFSFRQADDSQNATPRE